MGCTGAGQDPSLCLLGFFFKVTAFFRFRQALSSLLEEGLLSISDVINSGGALQNGTYLGNVESGVLLEEEEELNPSAIRRTLVLLRGSGSRPRGSGVIGGRMMVDRGGDPTKLRILSLTELELGEMGAVSKIKRGYFPDLIMDLGPGGGVYFTDLCWIGQEGRLFQLISSSLRASHLLA